MLPGPEPRERNKTKAVAGRKKSEGRNVPEKEGVKDGSETKLGTGGDTVIKLLCHTFLTVCGREGERERMQ